MSLDPNSYICRIDVPKKSWDIDPGPCTYGCNPIEIRVIARTSHSKVTKVTAMTHKQQTGFSMVLFWAVLAALPVASITNVLNQSVSAQEASFSLPTQVDKNTKIRIDGSESMSVINESLKQQFEQQFPGAKVELSTLGTDQALQNLEAGKADVASLGRLLTDAEKSNGLTPEILDREKIALVVGAENPFQGDIGYAQFAKIFRGEISDWSELGGSAGPIRLIDRPESSDTRQAFSTYPVFVGQPFTSGGTAEVLGQDDTAAMVKQLGQDGIGYALYSQVKDLPGIKILSMHKVTPDNAAYPYSQPRVLVYKGEPNDAVKSFLGFAANDPGQAAINAAESAESQAIASGNSPTGKGILQKFAAGAAGAAGAVGGAANQTVGAAGDAAKGAVDVAGNTAKGAVDAAGNVVGTAGDAAKGAATGTVNVAKDAAGTVAGVTAAGGEQVAQAVGGVATETGRGLSRLWGLLPLLALAAGGGLLWWLAAGKDEDEPRRAGRLETDRLNGDRLNGETEEARRVRINAGDRNLGQTLHQTGDGIRRTAGDLGTGAVNTTRGAIDGVRQGVSGSVDGVRQGVSGSVDGLRQGTGTVVDAGGKTLNRGAAAVGGAAAGAGGLFSGLFGRAKQATAGTAEAVTGTAQNLGNAAGNMARGTANAAGNVAQGTANAAGNAWQSTQEGVSNLGDGVQRGVSGTTQGTADTLENLQEGGGNAVDGLKKRLSDAGEALGDRLSDSSDYQ